MSDRAEHLTWCKKRALSYCDDGDTKNAIASMLSDLSKHNETQDHPGIKLAFMEMMAGTISTSDDARKFINGFN